MLRTLSFSIVLYAIVALAAAAAAQETGRVSKELTWSLPHNEVSSPRFSPDGDSIVLVTRIHWPDGDEAENLPDTVFKNLETRKQADPRFADPIIRRIDLQGHQTCEIRYGTTPSASSDNVTIAYSRQVKPITGFRQLAETMEGNDIELFDCATRENKVLAKPDTGYFDDPIFLPDKKSLVFTANEAVNGAWAGPVGFRRVDLFTGTTTALLSKQIVPALPCPPRGTERSDFERFMCSHGEDTVKVSPAFPSLVLGSANVRGQIVALQAVPVRAAGNVYMASHYMVRLVSLFPDQEQLLSMGEIDDDKLDRVAIQSAGERLMIFSGHWRLFVPEKKTWLPDPGPPNSNPRSLYSPDLQYYVAVESADEPNRVSVYRTADGQRLFTTPKQAEVFDVVWSPDSKRFAVVVVPLDGHGLNYREDLIVYAVR